MFFNVQTYRLYTKALLHSKLFNFIQNLEIWKVTSNFHMQFYSNLCYFMYKSLWPIPFYIHCIPFYVHFFIISCWKTSIFGIKSKYYPIFFTTSHFIPFYINPFTSVMSFYVILCHIAYILASVHSSKTEIMVILCHSMSPFSLVLLSNYLSLVWRNFCKFLKFHIFINLIE